MARYDKCIDRILRAAGRQLSQAQIEKIFTRIHKAALDINAGRAITKMSTKDARNLGWAQQSNIEKIAVEAAAQMKAEAAQVKRQASLQIVKLGARMADYQRLVAGGVKDLDAVEKLIARDYSGRINVESLEQRAAGYKAEFERKLLKTWDALGNDWLGFFQDKDKLLLLVRELRGEDTGDALARQGAKAFHDVAEEARQTFNEKGGDVGHLDDWGMPQHHSQEKVAAAGKQKWVDDTLPLLDRTRYADENGNPFTDAQVRTFLERAWETIATNGINKLEPGKFTGVGKRANRHAESRQVHFKDAESVIDYWDQYGERTAVEILLGHVDTMGKDIAFVDYFGPNPNTTFQTLRDTALQAAAMKEPTATPQLEGRAVGLDRLYNYASGNTAPTYRRWLSSTADAIAHLNAAGKLGGAALASFFGDKPVMEAVSHLNDIPVMQRWRTELSLLNPTNAADRRLLQTQGLMLDSVRSGLQRFYEGLGKSSTTGRLANGVMRITGMQAINDIRKGTFGMNVMAAIGNEIVQGKTFADLPNTDVRLLKNWGITQAEWDTWRIAPLDTMVGVENVLTPEGIARITDDQLRQAHVIGQVDGPEAAAEARRNAIVKLLGAVNTESDFAIVTPGWKERAAFYGSLQRGTVPGEIWRSVLQFKSFPWAYLQRGMDLVANSDGPAGKAAMTAYLVASTTLAGAMLLQTREMLSGKDPRGMVDDNWPKFWGAAFLQGGALGIYGDFLYGASQTRYGSGPLEAMAGPTVGPLLEMGVVAPLTAARQNMEGKDSKLAAIELRNLKGFVPGSNIWYIKAALDHMIWMQVMEQVSPGYLASIRQRTAKEYKQEWWYQPGDLTPDRAPDLSKAIEP